MTTNTNSLKFRFMATRFAIWDLHLYLDTHPDDCKARELLEKYYEKYEEISEEYCEKYGPYKISIEGNGNDWLKAPWPWDNSRGDC